MVRLRGVLALVVTMLMLGASSQAAVCELTCGVHAEQISCHSRTGLMPPMEMHGGHCSHAMGVVQQVGGEAVVCGNVSCNHASIPDFVKGGSAESHFAAVQWVVDVVPVELKVMGGSVAVMGKPPLLLGGVDPLSMSLRV